MISEALIKEFKEIAETELGIRLTQQEASEALLNLTGYFDLLAKLHHRNITKGNKGYYEIRNSKGEHKKD